MHIFHRKQNVAKSHFITDANISACVKLLTGDFE